MFTAGRATRLSLGFYLALKIIFKAQNAPWFGKKEMEMKYFR